MASCAHRGYGTSDVMLCVLPAPWPTLSPPGTCSQLEQIPHLPPITAEAIPQNMLHCEQLLGADLRPPTAHVEVLIPSASDYETCLEKGSLHIQLLR